MQLKYQLAAVLLLSMLLSTMTGAALAASGDNTAAPRQRLLMDFGWRFHLGDAPDAGSQFEYPEVPRLDKSRPDDDAQEAANAPLHPDAAATHLGEGVSFVQPGFDDNAWRTLDVPHDWSVELPFDHAANKDHGFKPVGIPGGSNIGWYRRSFTLPPTAQGKALWLEFDGVYRNSVVWLNGHCLGRNPSGYSSFSYDIRRAANYGGANTLVVRVDASRTEGWWYEGAGIYRHVWLMETGPVHVAHWGTYVTSVVQGANAEVTAQTTLRNDSAQGAACRLVSTLVDADGRSVGEATSAVASLAPDGEQTVTQKITVKGASLWSLERPYLYKLVSRVEVGSAVSDQCETPFGVRTIKWDPNKGFFLNGKHIYIKGTANHQDFAGVGIALPDRLQEDRVRMLQAMGSNAWRMAHNPPSPELLDACDRLGMLVLDEHRRMGTTPEILSELERLVVRDRNHPSIILWAIGNEEMSVQGSDAAAQKITVPMQNLVHKLDPTRPVTEAMNWDWGKGASKVIDVQGFNYRGNAIRGRKLAEQGDKRGFLDMDQFHAAFPNTPAVATEESSAVSTRGIYENDKTRAYLSAYDLNLPKGGNYTDLIRGDWGSTAESWWQYYATRPWIAGAFVWTGFDYRGEPTPYGWPNISSHFGIMDTCGFPKDNYYFYQSVWGDKPMVHLLPHWNWPGKEGQPIDVWAYSRADSVELLLNGKSLGAKPMPPGGHIAWSVSYAPGTLLARATRSGKIVATDTVETTGLAAQITLTPDRAAIQADGEDVSLVTVSATDSQGRPVPTADNLITFDITGSGKILGVGNGDPSSHEADKGTERSLFNGLALVIVQATQQPGPIRLTAHAPGLTPITLTLDAAASPARPVVP